MGRGGQETSDAAIIKKNTLATFERQQMPLFGHSQSPKPKANQVQLDAPPTDDGHPQIKTLDATRSRDDRNKAPTIFILKVFSDFAPKVLVAPIYASP